MTKAFKSHRAAWWLGGVAALVIGFLVAAVVLPTTAPVPGTDGPDVQLPRMQNVPPEGAPKMKIDVQQAPATAE